MNENKPQFIENISSFLAKMNSYKPDLKSLRIDYLDKRTELKLLITLPKTISSYNSKIEIPAYKDFEVTEIFNALTLDKLNALWVKTNDNLVAHSTDFQKSDKFFLILKGTIESDALNEIVQLYCPKDPKRASDVDRYWIDSAIKDMSVLEKIQNELVVDKVTTTINVGLERQFSSSIPSGIKEYFRAKAQADIYIASRDPNTAFKSYYRLRMAQKQVGKLLPADVYNVTSKVLSPNTFTEFVSVDKPFRISNVNPIDGDGFYPDKVGVTVQTDLSYNHPIAKGDLIYKKAQFANKLIELIDQMPNLPEKYKSKKLSN